MAKSKVFVALDPDRARGTLKVVSALGMPDLQGKSVLVKPNFNTADPPPGSTHIDTIRTIIQLIKEKNPKKIILGDRSGPAKTSKVFQEKGIFALAEELGFECLIFDEMPKDRWAKINPPDSHWMNGFWFAKPVLEADAVIGLCCLKTHQYGGHFTMSLKLTTGMVHSRNMTELHTSFINQRKMIAEMNYAYRPALVVMDGVEAFYSGGPVSGPRWKADLTFAATDRIALDAVGVAALKMHGTTPKIQGKRVFEQDQIKRAIELGLGVKGPEDVELVPVDSDSEAIAAKISSFLAK
ncbi:MAG: hypothetical protein A3K60_02550 [Euryarchaeota archaeon RBG_19FT_COMBO_56_21]|nr:MAG: hypothetical protein A3K60_02550 [Euryarchaeota archaeon RBG_19FT_COMBO_56_21]